MRGGQLTHRQVAGEPDVLPGRHRRHMAGDVTAVFVLFVFVGLMAGLVLLFA